MLSSDLRPRFFQHSPDSKFDASKVIASTIVARAFVTVIALVTATIASPCRGGDSPNVIFILCDDLGWGDLGVLHQNRIADRKRHQTPALDRIAKSGAILTRHYCPAPVCAPSRASLLLGVHQGHCGIRDNQFDKALPDNHTLGTVMRSAGYKTVMIGKYGLQGSGESASTWPAYPTRRGFDEFYGYVRHRDGHVHYPADKWALGNSPSHQTPKEVWHNDREVSAGLSGCYTTDLFTARAKRWIVDHRNAGDQPFMMYLAYDTPHAALQVPAAAYPPGRGVDGGIQWVGQAGRMINTAADESNGGSIDSYRHPDYVDPQWSDVEQRFATMVRRIDNAVDDLMATLDDLGIGEDTMVVFSSDNGPHKESYIAGQNYDPVSFQSYGMLDGIKRDVYEGGIRMPTFVVWPGVIDAGTVDDTPSQFHDWMATFADAAGVPAPARCDGVSILDGLVGEDRKAGTVYVEYAQNGRTPKYEDFAKDRRGRRRGQMQVVHVDHYKGVRYDIQTPNDRFEIYDLSNDPNETKDLADALGESMQRRMRYAAYRNRIPNATAKRPYDDVFVPSLGDDETAPKSTALILRGSFDYLPKVRSEFVDRTIDTEGLTPVADDQLGDGDQGAIVYHDIIEVQKDGDYNIELQCPSRSLVRIHGITVIDNDYDHRDTRSGMVRLAAGSHPIAVSLLYREHKTTPFTINVSPIDRN